LANSMRGHQSTIGKSTDWITPRWVLAPLGEFDLDPCTPEEMPWSTAKIRMTQEQDGLASPWCGRVWLNPPFDRRTLHRWLEKMADHGNGIALIPAATETKHFREFVWNRATSIYFLYTRPYFHFPSGDKSSSNSGCSICLVGYGAENDRILATSGLGFMCYITRAGVAIG
jgi:hypothetical protein